MYGIKWVLDLLGDRLIVIQMSNHYIVHLKLIQYVKCN